MYNILKKEQIDLLPLIRLFRKSFYLVGGTAIALHLGHRHSVDYDLFSIKKLKKKSIKDKITDLGFDFRFIYQNVDELTGNINNVKITFFNYPYDIPHKIEFEDIITLPNLLDLAAMKAYALGRRAKWKYYVDLFYIIKFKYSIPEISERAISLFQDFFSEKLFLQQLCYFKDIDYSEKVEYTDKEISQKEIKDFLVKIGTEPF